MTPDDSASMWLTLREAAEAFDVSLSTLHRRRRRGDLEDVGAFKDNDGNWKVPRQGLAQLGFREIVPPQVPGQVTLEETLSDGASESPATTPHDTRVTPRDSVELEELRKQLAEAQRRAEIAEAIAVERERVIKVQESALRLLEAPRREAPAEESRSEGRPEGAWPEENAAPRRRQWWKRIWAKD